MESVAGKERPAFNEDRLRDLVKSMSGVTIRALIDNISGQYGNNGRVLKILEKELAERC